MGRNLEALNRKDRRALRVIEGGGETLTMELDLTQVIDAIDVRTGKTVSGASGQLTLKDVILISLRSRLERDAELGGKEKLQHGLLIQRIRGVKSIDITPLERDVILRRCELVIDHPEVFVEAKQLIEKADLVAAKAEVPVAAAPETSVQAGAEANQ